MTNLLAETKEILAQSGKTVADVRWVGLRKRGWRNSESDKRLPVGSWADFEKFADFDYDSGYGGNEVAGGLVVVGDDWWLERGEYDGSEWWEFKRLPARPSDVTELRGSDLKE